MFIIGVTGNSGSGKSMVCRHLESKGAHVINADHVSRLILVKGQPAYDEVVKAFGQGILAPDGEIDRKILGELVFRDKAKLNQLTEITHKYILSYMRGQVDIIGRSEPDAVVVFDAPLLVESGLNKACSTVWVVDSLYLKKIKRIMERDNISQEMAELRLSNQTPSEKLRLEADEVILNNGTTRDLINQVDRLYNHFV